MSRRITIEDVAKHAGVSKVTVSYVLNGRSTEARISTATQERVQDAVDQLGYRINGVARSLSRRRTDTLGVVLQSGSYFSAWSGFTSELMRGVSEACYESGFDVMLHTKGIGREEVEATILADGRVDGLLVLRDEDDRTLLKLVDHGVPCVQFFTHSEDLPVPSVDLDNELGGHLATRHLIKLGHREIVMLCGSSHSVSSLQRVKGYQRALRDAGIDPRPEWTVATDYESDLSPLLDLLCEPAQAGAVSRTPKPTAVFAWSDDVALRLMSELRKRALRVPEDVSVVGFDSLPGAENAAPPLTSVRQPVREMAARATRMLIGLVRGETLPTSKIF